MRARFGISHQSLREAGDRTLDNPPDQLQSSFAMLRYGYTELIDGREVGAPVSRLRWERENDRKKMAKQGVEYVDSDREGADAKHKHQGPPRGQQRVEGPHRSSSRKAPPALVKADSVAKKQAPTKTARESAKRYSETRDGKIRAIRAL